MNDLLTINKVTDFNFVTLYECHAVVLNTLYALKHHLQDTPQCTVY